MYALRKYFFLLQAVLLLVGCARESPLAEHEISEQEAIDAALDVVSMSRPEMSGAQIHPSNIQAEQMSFEEATKRIDPRNTIPAGYDPDMPVWFVTMDGLWFNEASSPTDPSTPIPYRHFMLIIDATSGSELESAARP